MSLKIRSSRNWKLFGILTFTGVSTFIGCSSDTAPPPAPLPMGQAGAGAGGMTAAGGQTYMPMAGTGGTPVGGGGGTGGGGTGGGGTGGGGTGGGGSGGTPAGGAGSTGLPAIDCDDGVQVKAPLPVVVTEAGFIVSGYYETSATEFLQVNEACPDRPPGAAGTCLVFEWTPATRTWVGVLMQYPANNWGGPTGGPGLCIADGAEKVIFSARAEEDGVTAAFGAVGVETGDVELTTEWQDFELDISAVNYNEYNTKGGVNGGFSIVMVGTATDPPKKIYVDNIQWIGADGPGGGGAGGMAGAGGAGGGN